MVATAKRGARAGPVWRGVVAAALAIVGLAAGGCATAVEASAGGDSLPVHDYPSAGVAAPPVCPSTWEVTEAPTPTRAGALVPEGGTEALLCTYPIPLNPPQTPGQQALGSVHPISDPAVLIAYLNGLPTYRTTPPQTEYACPAAAGTQYTIVIGYPDRQPAVVRLSSCVIEQGGSVRHGADLRVLIAFFGASLNE